MKILDQETLKEEFEIEIWPKKQLHTFQKKLLNWYDKNQRELPWRENNNPYRIWVSEIMLQQTRVETVIPYFNHFMEKFPNVQELANSSEDEILKAWEGLGYYSRARNLRAAAQQVMIMYKGVIPDTYDELIQLKGIGPYTAGAISSMAFNRRVPAVDGNVMRVVSRFIESLLYDVSHGGQARPNDEYRKYLKQIAETSGNRTLWEKLNEIDPAAAEKIHENNQRRVVRALEVYKETGQIYSSYQQERQVKNKKYHALIIGLNTERQMLYQRINQRVDRMIKMGLLEEAKRLINTVPETSQSLKGIGYREFIPYVQGQTDLETVSNKIKQNSRRYAKRQLTWFRNRLKVKYWYDLVLHPEDIKIITENVTSFLEGEVL